MAVSTPAPLISGTCLLFLLITCAATTDAAAANTTFATNDTITASTFQELETTLQTLRNHGFTLFTNGIATSDIQIQLLSTNSSAATAHPFTLLAPKDVQLFTLDMASSAASYISTLRYHVIPNRRLTFSDLLNLTSSFLDTLLPQHSVLIGKIKANGASGVVIDGIRLSEPDLFLGQRFAVHGIDGILVTGLIDYDLFNVNHKDSDHVSPSSRPLPGNDWNIPADGYLDPESEYNRNNIPMAPQPKFDRRLPAAAHKKPRKGRGKQVRGHSRHRRKREGRHVRFQFDSV
ncbi:hypothetical protein F511_38882 [Dorcoceras hygrometricum]|uniref:FAS1 domain-containing protein n=1 Tax=Dorcoceras hygrometricum TaxID=472368 RepID=A0A2Z7AY73_9LAMI|nr:hypothetical protein F511_38882 [Dorcoceras hygrometricum]